MYIVAVDGVGAEPLRDRLVHEMAARGPVATIRRTGARASASGPTTVELDSDGRWTASGSDGSLTDQLDRLAPHHRFAVLLTGAETEWPRLVADAGTVRGDLLSEPTPRDAVDVPALVDRLETTEPYVTLESLVSEVKGAETADRAGAIATFTGRVRAKEGPDDDATEYLEFETYAGVAEEKMAALEEELEEREGVWAVRMHHRTGVIQAGQDIVFVVVLAGHREEAFRTVEDGINRLKAEVPIFKKEVTEADEYWVHTRP